jgi:uroporphyrinogen-III synthase
MRQLLLVRPEPGLSASAERARQAGLDVIARPLFRIEPLDWEAPDPHGYDGLLLTSANALRYAGSRLDGLKSLPAHAVGPATADAARAAGLKVATVGEDDLTDLLARLPVEMPAAAPCRRRSSRSRDGSQD